MENGTDRKTWWVYMISCRGGKIYTGTAIDPEARYQAHRAGKGAAFTRANPPVALLRSAPFGTRSEACKAEAALRKMPRGKKLSWTREPDEGSRGPISSLGSIMRELPESGGRLKMSKVPRVNRGKCISCGVCVDTCPAVFRFGADNRSEVYDLKGADEASIQEAIDLCPLTCISWDVPK